MTSRLKLRPPRLADAPQMTLLLDNFAVAGNLARVPHPYRLGDAEMWLRSRRGDLPAEETGFMLELNGEGLIGHIGFHRGMAGPVLGYWLGEQFWNRRLMSEAVPTALDWFFGESQADAVFSGVFDFNRASLAIQQRLGFSQCGTSSIHCLARGQDLRHIDTELTRARWAAGAARDGDHSQSGVEPLRATTKDMQ